MVLLGHNELTAHRRHHQDRLTSRICSTNCSCNGFFTKYQKRSFMGKILALVSMRKRTGSWMFSITKSTAIVMNTGRSARDTTSIGDKMDCNTWTQGGLVTPYGIRHFGQHWFRQWLVAPQHQAITWTNIDSSRVGSCFNLLRLISQGVPKKSIPEMLLKIHISHYSQISQGQEYSVKMRSISCLWMPCLIALPVKADTVFKTDGRPVTTGDQKWVDNK